MGVISNYFGQATETTLGAVKDLLTAILAGPIPISGTVTATIDETTLAKTTQLPAALGRLAAAASASVTLSTEDAAKVPALGQALAASSSPVVLTAIQIAQLAQTGQLPAALGTKSGATSLGVALSTEDAAKVPALGQALAASSVPVVLTSIQSAALAQDATLTGGTAQAQLKSGLKGASTAALITSTANGVDHQGVDSVEQYAPAYENNTDQVAMVQYRMIGTSTGASSLTSSASGGVGTAGVSIKASAGRISWISVTNANATTGFYLQVFNKSTAAVANDVPIYRIWVPSVTIAGAGGKATETTLFGFGGLYLSTGISIAASSTVGLLTLLAATDMHYSVMWI